MSETLLLLALQKLGVLLLVCTLPPLGIAALTGLVVEVVLSRLGVRESGLPALARVMAGIVAVLLLAPWMGTQVVQLATAIWSTHSPGSP
ncbi:MAG TPA: flagellar biosynthetic protein FliQ [Pseudomonadota bacterium]|jgi:type III secretory pathway component EscS|nr:flagellar biosynthetic protein FliQ [Pseudomonadota bacterium]